MSILIALILVFSLISALILLTGRNKKNIDKKGKTVNKAKIMKEAQKRLAKNPNDPQGLVQLGSLYFDNKLWDKAHPIFTTLLKIGIQDTSGTIDLFETNLRLGICSVQLEKYQDAVNSLSGAYKLNPVDFDVNYYLALTLFKIGQNDKATPLLKKALMLKPFAPGVNLLLAQSLYNSHKYKESISFFKKALDEEPGNKEALFGMADAMSQDNHGDKAIKVFMHLRPDPVYGTKACREAGLFHLKINDIDSAIQDYEIGLKHKDIPQDLKLEMEYNLAKCYFDKNQLQSGLKMLQTIHSENANYKDVNALIGRYQELSQNSNLQIYVSAPNSAFVVLCRKIVQLCFKSSTLKFINIESEVLFTDILTEIQTSKWEDVALFRFFRTTGTTGEMYIRDFHSHMQDIKAARGFCISAGVFSNEARRYIEGRPLDLVEKSKLTQILKKITM